MRTIRAITDNNPHTFGIELLQIPLDDTDNPAIGTINRADFDLLMDLGCSDVWWINKDGNVVCWGGLSKRALVISRLILDAGPSEIVKYADGDNLNLRRTNLRIVKRGKGSKRREREFLLSAAGNRDGPDHQRQYKPRCKIVTEYLIRQRGINDVPYSSAGVSYAIPAKYKTVHYHVGREPGAMVVNI
jgi:hypothetical protein